MVLVRGAPQQIPMSNIYAIKTVSREPADKIVLNILTTRVEENSLCLHHKSHNFPRYLSHLFPQALAAGEKKVEFKMACWVWHEQKMWNV